MSFGGIVGVVGDFIFCLSHDYGKMKPFSNYYPRNTSRLNNEVEGGALLLHRFIYLEPRSNANGLFDALDKRCPCY